MSKKGTKKDEVEPASILEGKFAYKDGSSYVGQFKEVKTESADALPRRVRQGVGEWKRNGETYNGEWKDDKMSGTGSMTFADGSKYEGNWLDNTFEGTGVYTWKDGSKYIGDFHRNLLHGKGTYSNAAGDSWHGKFHNDSFENENGEWISVSQLDRYTRS